MHLAIIGFCYGSLVPNQPDDVSYTEFEFLTATQARIPRLIFMIDEDTPFPPRLIDAHRGAIDGFRTRLRSAGVLVKVVGSPHWRSVRKWVWRGFILACAGVR